ncbi:hypothetical protein PpSQ1_01635 [Pseudomonas putida]|nr:hypothetical protein PpSQ1_01635 [Pseudomonas putida]
MFRLIHVLKPSNQEFVAPSTGGATPFKSVIVGGNATGKTRFIVSLIESFRLLSEAKEQHGKFSTVKKKGAITEQLQFKYYINGDLVECVAGDFGVGFTVDGEEGSAFDLPLPSRVLAISSTVNDKFPFADSDEDDFYRYCGVRETSNASWTATLSRRTIENLLNIPLRHHHHSLDELFKYLGISPTIEVTFSLKNLQNFRELVADPGTLMLAVQGYSNQSSRLQVQMFRNFSYEDAARACSGLANREFTGRNNSVIIDLSDTLADYSDLYFGINVFRRIGMISDVELNIQKFNTKKSFGFGHSSSGETQLLYTFSSLIRHAKPNCLIFIDEPELSLHPSWQIKYVALLKRALASFPGSHVIIATHSHFIISDLEKETSSLHVFENKDEQLCVRNVEYSTYAWSADHILYDVFDVRTVGNLAFESDLAEALKLISSKPKDCHRLVQLKKKFERLVFNESDPLHRVIKNIAEIVNAHQ